MKRLFTLSAICVAMLSLVGCDSKQKAIYEWAKGEVNHFAALETEHPSLYYIKDHIGLHLMRVDLDTFESKELLCFNDNEYMFISSISDYIIPEDRGYGESTTFVITGHDYKDVKDYSSSEGEVALTYDTTTDRVSEICRGENVYLSGDMIVNAIVPSRAQNITKVDVLDLQGNALELKTYVGTIAKQSVVVKLVERDGALAGYYYYTKYGPGTALIALVGSVDENRNMNISGFNWADSVCEVWTGTFKEGQISAVFESRGSYSRKKYEFTLTEQK